MPKPDSLCLCQEADVDLQRLHSESDKTPKSDLKGSGEKSTGRDSAKTSGNTPGPRRSLFQSPLPPPETKKEEPSLGAEPLSDDGSERPEPQDSDDEDRDLFGGPRFGQPGAVKALVPAEAEEAPAQNHLVEAPPAAEEFFPVKEKAADLGNGWDSVPEDIRPMLQKLQPDLIDVLPGKLSTKLFCIHVVKNPRHSR